MTTSPPKPRVVNLYQRDDSRLPCEEIIQYKVTDDNIYYVLNKLESGLVVVRLVGIFRTLSPSEITSTIKMLRKLVFKHGILQIEEALEPTSNAQLVSILEQHGFPVIRKRTPDEDISTYVNNRSPSSGKFLIEACSERQQHQHDTLLFPDEFKNLTEEFKQSPRADVSWIITVNNEEKTLPHSLSFLEAINDETKMRREFIFVVNGCTDISEQILREYCENSQLDARVISSKIGILAAYKAGIASRKYNGYVGRFDADIFLHPHSLDLMQMNLANNTSAQVTYAEPLPLEAPNEFNVPYHRPETATQRLYYTGKTHLFREDPYNIDGIRNMPEEFIADDIFVSFYLIYYYGFEAISRTPHAVVYERVVGSFDELAMQFSRATSEIMRIMNKYPHFKVLDAIVEQKFSDGPYKDLTDKARAVHQYTTEWTRLETTK